MEKDVIIACDFKDANQLWVFLKKFKDHKPFLKIGYQLFYATGNDLICKLKKQGYKIFLDLKLHDIPNTVAGAISSLNHLQVDFLSLHASGGKAMLLAAKKTINKHTKLLAITQLTSTDQIMLQKELLINKPLNQVVSHYAKLAASAKIDGVVCAVNEVQIVKKITKQNFITVCPGIRESITNHDQKRVASIAQAQKSGANYVVIGRPITTAVDPLNAYLAFKKQF